MRDAMRKLLLSTVALPFLVCVARLDAAEPELTREQIARLESLCRVWGVVKFFHPWIVAPPEGKPIDWDAALVETIPLVENASAPEEFAQALNRCLERLGDRATRATLPASDQSRSQQPAAEPVLPETRVVEADGKKILAIDATDWRPLAAFQRKAPGELFAGAFEKAADAESIILDLRRKANVSDAANEDSMGLVMSALRSGITVLLKNDLILAASRSRFHSGYVPEQGITSGAYHSGFSLSEPTVITAKPGPAAGKRIVILTNAAIRNVPLLAALQSTGQAIILHHADAPQPFAFGTTYSMRLADGVFVQVRTADAINADGTFGLVPDITVEKLEESDGAVMTIAVQLASGQRTPPSRSPRRLPAAPLRIAEKRYPEMTSPSREYRLLGLFRVWNVMFYFFPYKHLMDRSWDSVLTEFIPRFAGSSDAAEYGIATREFIAHLQDSHVTAFGSGLNPAMERLGTAVPLVRLRPLRGELLIAAVEDSVKDKVKVGDVVLDIDDEPVRLRMNRLEKYVAASTPQSLSTSLAEQILRGPLATSCKLKLRDPAGTVREEALPRLSGPAVGAARRRLYQSSQRKTPVFSVLPQGFGYFDLVRLTVQQVNEAFDTVKDTPALIMDMRGYPQGTAWSICARLTAEPMTMATFRRPYWTSPFSGSDRFAFDQPIQPSPLWKYTQRVIVLINEDAMSQSEHSCLGFEEAAKGRITFIGTPTIGANGDITNTSMPGGITVMFSGHDVRHADGRQLQRVGIQPDIRVEPTIEGIVAGNDEVLEAAIKFLNESKAR